MKKIKHVFNYKKIKYENLNKFVIFFTVKINNKTHTNYVEIPKHTAKNYTWLYMRHLVKLKHKLI